MYCQVALEYCLHMENVELSFGHDQNFYDNFVEEKNHPTVKFAMSPLSICLLIYQGQLLVKIINYS